MRSKINLPSVLLLLAFSGRLGAQVPTIKTDGKESNQVYLQQLSVNVSIFGSIATTTWTMTFKNTTPRILEGELNFPLPQGVSVSRYALDINGGMREAVPVEKEKATRVFENTERRRVDPGILERVEGNSFRTRIYPINPNGTRTVLIGYEEELSGDGPSGLLYRLPLAFKYHIEDFAIIISVLGKTGRPVVAENVDEALRFDEWQARWSATRQWKAYQADRSISIHIPKASKPGAVLMQPSGNHYFYVVSAFPLQKKIERALPHYITILWDASFNEQTRDLKKDMGLLDAYLSRIGEAEITLVDFSNTVVEPLHFTVHNGQWKSLRSALNNTVYDGAAQFGALDLRRYPCDEFLLFSNGHSNWGSDDIRLSDRPVYAVSATAGADFSFLQSITGRSGGECVNLDKISTEQAKDMLLYQGLHFMGVRHSDDLGESYPSISTPVINGITVAGISYKPVQEIVLQFGYGGKVTSEERVALNLSKQQLNPSGRWVASPLSPALPPLEPDLSHVWAQKKIAELDTRYEDNKVEIGQLGKRYGIVTRNTSLIVLENVIDYITYQIEPPADLREAFDHIMKGREQSERQTRQSVVDNAEKYFNDLLYWWRGEEEKTPPVSQNNPPPTLHRVPLQPTHGANHARTDTIEYSSGLFDRRPTTPTPMLMATTIRGAASGVAVDYDQTVVMADGKRYMPDNNIDADGSRPVLREVAEGRDIHGSGVFTASNTEVRTDYLDKIKAAAPGNRYNVYLLLRNDHRQAPLFFFNTACLFLAEGKKDIGLRILSNIAGMDLENYELFKMLGYKLKELGEAEAACRVFKKVLDWRPFEPQSYRDYGLALEDAGRYQQALDTLYLALVKNYDANISALYPGIEETILPEINNLVTMKKNKVDASRIPRNILADMPVDIRVVLNWNMNNTDIDLWVTDPNNEKCYYAHKSTGIGGRISHDFTRGLGPEQFLLKRAIKGTYKVEVNYYGDTQVKLAGATTIMAEVYTGYGSPQQTRRIITLQMLPESKGTVYVGEFEFR